MTKRENFVEVIGVLEGIEGTEALVEAIKHEVDLLDKRAEKGRGETKTQKENAELKETIVGILETAGEGVTATDVAKALDVTVQKASQLLKQLVTAGEVARTEAKGKEKAKFAVA